MKDIVSMYNTPRTEPAYILLGVRKSSDGNFKVTGVRPISMMQNYEASLMVGFIPFLNFSMSLLSMTASKSHSLPFRLNNRQAPVSLLEAV